MELASSSGIMANCSSVRVLLERASSKETDLAFVQVYALTELFAFKASKYIDVLIEDNGGL